MKTAAKIKFFIPIVCMAFALFFACENTWMEEVLEEKIITFDSNGGSKVPSQTLYKGERAAKPKDPVKSGNIFLGWYKDNGTFEELYDFAYIPASSMTLYANWRQDTTGGVEVINSVSVTLSYPVKDGFMSTTATTTDLSYTCGTVTWESEPAHSGSTFLGDTVYTATVTLTANKNYMFSSYVLAKINTVDATILSYNEKSITISRTFPKTSQVAVTAISIKTQPTKLTYVYGENLNLDGLEVTLTYDDNKTQDVLYNQFDANSITATPSNGTKLTITDHNNTPVVVSVSETIKENTNNLTVKKADGMAIGVPVITGNVSNSTITVDSVPNSPNNGQIIEYAKDTVSNGTPNDWQDSMIFSGIGENTAYYIFARSKENENYTAGPVSVSASPIAFYRVTFNSNGGSTVADTHVQSGNKITQPTNPARSGYTFDGWYKEAGIQNEWIFEKDTVTASTTLYAKWIENTFTLTLTMEAIEEATKGDGGLPTEAGLPITISRSGTGSTPKTYTVTVTGTGTYSSILWKVEGVGAFASVTGNSNSFTLDSENVNYNTLGGHVLELTVEKDGKTYQVNIPFNIIE